ncbi:MAG: glycosyltransferase [Bacteroidales bacterium]|nr:glycosyltransferase [Bacteroidales bacterium]
MKTLIVIPCYNECNRLNKEEFFSFVSQNDDIEFLFVNDGSTDSTLAMLQSFSASNNKIHYLDLAQNGGKAEAVRQGILLATSEYDCAYVGFWDADLATPLNEIKHFERIIDHHHYDCVTGLRLMRLGAQVRRKYSRHYIGRFFASLAAFVLDLPVYDTQCGAKLYKVDIAKKIFEQKFITRWLFDVELLARYINLFGKEEAKTRIYENPVMKWQDVSGSQLKMKDFFKAPYELWKIMRTYHSRRK